jgi:hypothetical protein
VKPRSRPITDAPPITADPILFLIEFFSLSKSGGEVPLVPV